MITLTLAMPRLGETMDSGTIASWNVAQGESFERGDTLLELETDKTLVEYPALGSGRLVETLVAEGEVVDVGDPIAIIETDKTWPIVSDQDAGASTFDTDCAKTEEHAAGYAGQASRRATEVTASAVSSFDDHARNIHKAAAASARARLEKDVAAAVQESRA